MYRIGLNIPTFEAKVLVGTLTGYSKEKISFDEVKKAIRKSAHKVKGFTFSGNITQTYIIVSGENEFEEPAVVIESSIYPRFPQEKEKFKKNFIEFIGNLAMELKQERICIRFTDESLMIETEYSQHPDIKP